MELILDHIAVACAVLEDGAADVARALGTDLQAGGQHAHFGTHNRLLGLGPDYLEVIAIDPTAPPLEYPRWFDLDTFAGPPRLTNWIARTASLDAAVEALGPGYGAPVALSRGALRWRMAVPQSGKLPFSNSSPALIEWETDPPHAALTDRGYRLRQLSVRHPEAEALAATLAPFLSDARVVFEAGTPGLQARIDTPQGPRVIA